MKAKIYCGRCRYYAVYDTTDGAMFYRCAANVPIVRNWAHEYSQPADASAKNAKNDCPDFAELPTGIDRKDWQPWEQRPRNRGLRCIIYGR
jgi:hypothetical protein